jgi:hypothetical protein
MLATEGLLDTAGSTFMTNALFPELVPAALVLTLGLSTLLPASWRRGWLLLWLCFWPALAAAALLRLSDFYI